MGVAELDMAEKVRRVVMDGDRGVEGVRQRGFYRHKKPENA